jgi:hypothetical protein
MKRFQREKARFLRRYNSSGSTIVALRSAINAAVQHNPLYRSGSRRFDVRAFWKAELERIAIRYADPQSKAEFAHDITELRRRMRRRFGSQFLKSGFRVSHAQKSLSVFLKHCWCLGLIDMPPACPIDRRILRAVTPRPTPAWTTVDSVKEHRRMLNRVAAVARSEGLEIAEWELLTFDPEQ